MDFFFPVSLCVPREAAEAPECDRGTQGKFLSHSSPANHMVSGVPAKGQEEAGETLRDDFNLQEQKWLTLLLLL